MYSSTSSLMLILRSYGKRVDILSNEVKLIRYVLKRILDYLKKENPLLDSCDHEFSDEDLIQGQERRCLKCNAKEELVEAYILCREYLESKN